MTTHYYDELLRLNPDPTPAEICMAQERDINADKIATEIAAACLIYYKTLIDLWPSLTGSTQEKMAQVNAMLGDDAITPWWQVNGYTSPFTENDLIAAGGLS